MNKTLTICLLTLLTLNIAVFSQKAKTATAPQKIDGYIFKNSGTTLLNDSNVCNLDYRLLVLARNEIYARRGYIFKDKSLQNYFNNRKWYKSNAKFTGKLSDIEQKNVALISKFEVIFKKNENVDDNKRKIYNESNFDINGDGKIDKIKYKVHSEPKPNDEFGTYTITINGVTVKADEISVHNTFSIIDIDENDKLKEIAVEEDGFSEDFMTTFYCYTGGKIFKMGKIEGLSGSYKRINGKGTVYANTRFRILQTWYYKDEYKLSSKHLLQHVDKPYYLASSATPFDPSIPPSSVTVLKSIHLYEKPENKKIIVKLKVGEKVDIIGSDDKEWCLVKTKTGKTGWFALDKLDKVRELGIEAQEVFEGLCEAD